MRQNSNFETSEAQNSDLDEGINQFVADFQTVKDEPRAVYGSRDNTTNSSNASFPTEEASVDAPGDSALSDSRPWTASVLCSPPDSEIRIPAASDSRKKITSIIVLYSDNSFETFNPSTD